MTKRRCKAILRRLRAAIKDEKQAYREYEILRDMLTLEDGPIHPDMVHRIREDEEKHRFKLIKIEKYYKEQCGK